MYQVNIEALKEIAAINPTCFTETVELIYTASNGLHHASENCRYVVVEWDTQYTTLLNAVTNYQMCTHCVHDLVKDAGQENVLKIAQRLISYERYVGKTLGNTLDSAGVLGDLAKWPTITDWRNLQTCKIFLETINEIDAPAELQAWKDRVETSIRSYMPDPVNRKLLDIELLRLVGIAVFQNLMKIPVEMNSNEWQALYGGDEAFGLFENCTEQDFDDDGWEIEPLAELAQLWCAELWAGKTPQAASETILVDETAYMAAIGEARGPWLRLHRLTQPIDEQPNYDLEDRLWQQHSLKAGRKALHVWSEHFGTILAPAPDVLVGWNSAGGTIEQLGTDTVVDPFGEGRMVTTIIEALNWTTHQGHRIIVCHPVIAALIASEEIRMHKVWKKAIPLGDAPTQEELVATAILWEPDNTDSPYHNMNKALAAAKLL